METTEIYALKIPNKIDQELYSKFINIVSYEKRKKLNCLFQTQDVYRSLIADVLVRFIVYEKYNLSNDMIEFKYDRYGKPFLGEITNFHFNISHSGKWITCIIDNDIVGIDIEKMIFLDFFSIAEAFFSKEEYQNMSYMSPKNQQIYFFDLWTLKESFLKALGQGLNIPLNNFTIKKYSDCNISIEQNIVAQNFHFRQYFIEEGYKLSTCAKKENFPQKISFKDVSEIQKIL